MSKVEEKLASMELTLPEPVPPAGSYMVGYRAGNLVFLSGVGPRAADGSNITGKLGAELTIEQGQEAARRTALRLLSNLKSVIGDLDKLKHVVKVFGMVQCAPGFTSYGAVTNGCSDLLMEIFGEKGKHARTSMGVSANPFDGAVSIEMVVEVGD